MPIEVADTDNGLGVIVTGEGVVTDEDYLPLYRAHLSQDREKYSKYRYGLHDWSAVTDARVSNKAINEVAELCKEAALINPYPVSALVAPGDLTFGLSRMWENLATDTRWEIIVLRSRAEAEDWIRQRLDQKYQISDLAFA